MLFSRFFMPAGGILLLVLVSGCASNNMYRDQLSSCVVSNEQTCEAHTIQRHKAGETQEYLVSFVEIDDQGQLRDRKQMQVVLDELYTMAAKESLLINVFVHGWHHNASFGDENVEHFKQSLAHLSRLESELAAAQNKQPRKVVGVYVGWRGESIDFPVLSTLTFWDRKNTAEEVGLLGMAELLLRLEEISNVKNTMEPPIKSRLVLIGHSFGGAAVYNATSQILASRFVDSRAGKAVVDDAKGFGDLVVLMNPAFEALRYAALFDLAQARCSYFPTQHPRLVILTSKTDYATKIAFPAGRIISTLFETHGDIQRNDCKRPLSYAEGAADRATVGHFDPLTSHSLEPLAKVDASRVVSYETVASIWGEQKENESVQYGSTVLTHLGKTAARNPYLNVEVDKALMDGHNDIYGEEIAEFLRMLIVLSARE